MRIPSLLVIALLSACGSPAVVPQATEPPPSTQALESRLPSGRAPAEGIYTAGQPSEADLEAVRDAGVRTVVNLRPAADQPYDEKQAVELLGMHYVGIEVDGAAGLTADNAAALDGALAGEGPVLVHCGSGNRAGALFGLRAGLLQGAELEAAVELGKAHGMTTLEPALREALSAAKPAAP